MQEKWCVTQAKAAAASFGVDLAAKMGWPKVVLECDALNVVRAVNKSLMDVHLYSSIMR